MFGFLKKKSTERKKSRKKLNIPVTINPGGYNGKVRDISETGISFESFAILKQDNLVDLEFSLSKNSKVLRATAFIRTIKREDGKSVFGCEFTESSAETKKYLSALLLLYK